MAERMILLDESQHDGLGYHVDHGSTDDVEVGVDQQFCMPALVGTL